LATEFLSEKIPWKRGTVSVIPWKKVLILRHSVVYKRVISVYKLLRAGMLIRTSTIDWTIEGTIDWTIDWTIESTIDWTIEGTIDWTIEGTIEWTIEGTIEWTIEDTIE
jgi:hypothetical protein